MANPVVGVTLKANTDGFTRGLKAATAAAGATLAAFAAAGTAAVAKVTGEVLRLSDELNDLAKAAKRAGVGVREFDRMDKALRLLTASGVDTALAFQEFQARTGEAAFDLAALAGEFEDLDGQAARTSRAIELFGARVGREMAGALSEGEAAVRSALEAVEAQGLASAEAAVQAEQLQDAVALASMGLDSMRRVALEPLIPAMTAVLAVWQELMRAFRTGAEEEITTVSELLGTRIVSAAVAASVNVVSFGKDVQIAMVPALAAVEALHAGIMGAASALVGDRAEAARFFRLAEIRAGDAKDAALGLVDAWKGNRAAVALLRVELEAAARASGDLTGARGPSGAPTTTGDGGADAEGDARIKAALRAKRDAADEAVQITRERDQAIDEIERTKHGNEMARIGAATAARVEAAATTLAVAASTLNAIGDLIDVVSDIEIRKTKEGSAAREEAERKAWQARTAVAIASAAINIPLSISQASAGPWPASLGFMIAAGAASTAALVGVIAKASQGPSFHSGGEVGAARAGMAPDEVSATLIRGERVLSRAEARERRGPVVTVTAFQVGHRLVDAQVAEGLRAGTGRLSRELRAARPRRVGRRNPWAV